MHRSLIKNPPGSRDRTPFVYAVVVIKSFVESSATTSHGESKLVHAIVGVERVGHKAEGVKKVKQGVIYRRAGL